jgi:PTS system cellobiose-specific IIB component
MSTESSPQTNLLVTKMNNKAKKRKLNIIVQAHSISKLNEKAQEADVLLLSPELYSEAKDIKLRFPDKVVAVIDKKEYGLLDAANILLSVNS